jgi:hypothetical protein
MDLIKNSAPERDSERAKRAVTRFRGMLPGLNGYVRAISGNKNLRIELAAGQPRTDGRKIYFEPPIELGDDLTHVRTLCDKRDPETMKQLCYGCDVREDLLIKIYHEIAHNAYGTFEQVASNRELKLKVYEEINKLEPKYADQIQKTLWNNKTPATSYMDLAARVNPFLPVIVNALEDLRVDEAMFKARRGTRIMFYAMTRSTFVNGTTTLDGSIQMWKDMPLNSQAIVGIFVLGCKYAFDGWFDPKVEAALKDEKIQSLVSDADELKSALETFERAFPILERLRELGFCLTEEEYDEKDQQNGEDDSVEESDDSDGDGSSESPDNDEGEADNAPEGDTSEGEGTSGSDAGSGSPSGALEDDAAESVPDAPDEVQPESRADESGDQVDLDDGEDGPESDAGSDSGSSSDGSPELGDEDESDSGSGAGEGS